MLRRLTVSASAAQFARDAGPLLGWLVGWWAWTPAVYGLGYCLRYVTPGHKVEQSADQWFYANFLSFDALLWVWLTIGFIGSVIIALVFLDDGPEWLSWGVGALALLLALASFVQAWRVAWDDDKDRARYYLESTVFHSPSLAPDTAPPSLDWLLSGAEPTNRPGCALAGDADVPSCIVAGALPTTGWDARVSSYNGAIFALSRSSGDMQDVSLNSSTVKYLNAWHGLPARWSGVLDGTGITQGMGGVAEWNGSTVTTCDFSGQYAIDRSFGGSSMADLPDYLAQQYPGLRWTIGDVWGYCDGTQPVVVVPVTRIVRFMNRTVDTAAGIITVRGHDGSTSLTYSADVRAGSLPGPVYPESLVKTQLSQTQWGAGRGAMNDGGFGYGPTDASAQEGNTSDYLLRDTATGHLEWVTPLTLRDSSSQLFVAYAVSDADTVTSGSLNTLAIYVLSPSDPRQINVDNMEAEARNWLSQQQPGFISSGGKLLEFTPLGGNRWRAYGELNGRVVYLLDIDATGRFSPTLTSVSPLGLGVGGAGAVAGNAVCGKPLSSLSTSQIATCLRQFADQLATREGAPAG
jgi:hypothetical protein